MKWVAFGHPLFYCSTLLDALGRVDFISFFVSLCRLRANHSGGGLVSNQESHSAFQHSSQL